MLKVLSAEQMQLVDKRCATEFNINTMTLMENAGIAVHKEIINHIEQQEINDPEALVICGKGNNGGDGFVVARLLVNSGINTIVISLFDKNEIADAARHNLDILPGSVTLLYSKEISDDDFISYVQNADIIVDAILGTGINTNIRGEALRAVELINSFSEVIVISVDIPSGISADTGKILGSAVSADCTVCLETVKIGNIMPPATDFNGEVVIAGIGIPDELINLNQAHKINLLTAEYISEILPYRISDGNKGDFGKVLSIVGSQNLPGSGYLSSKSILKAGAGYSMVCCGNSLITTYAQMCPELIYKAYDDENRGYISHKNLDQVLESAQNADVILLGCGIGTNHETVKFVKNFLIETRDFKIPIIIDAVGLNCISLIEKVKFSENTLLTPHPLELARLLKVDKNEVIENRIDTAKAVSAEFNVTVLSKGLRTIIVDKEENVYINSTGNNALAKAGTGDVLSGMIAGFAAQTGDILTASQIGAFLHGLAGDIYRDQNNEYSLIASELIDYICYALNNISKI